MTADLDAWVRVCAASELAPNSPLQVSVGGTVLAIVQTDEGLFAVDDTCSHAQWSLSDGEVDDCTIECSLHGARFDLRTGNPSGLPAIVPIATYPVTIDGDSVLVKLNP